jgi:hypothetical protein
VENNEFWRAVTSLAMIHAKHLVIYWHPKGRKTEATSAKLKDYFSAAIFSRYLLVQKSKTQV